MSESKDEHLTNISKARTAEEIGAFWDEHSLADFWDETHEVEFEVRASRYPQGQAVPCRTSPCLSIK